MYPKPKEMRLAIEEKRILFSIDFENFIACNFDIREILVCYQIFDGYSITEIAKHEGYSRRTITSVVSGIRKKFSLFLKNRGYYVKESNQSSKNSNDKRSS